MHLSLDGYNAVVHTLSQTATATNPPVGGWVGITVCPILLREYMDAKRVNSVGGSSDVDRSFADNKEFPIF